MIAWLASLDLEYHNVDPERGLFLGLEADGRTTGLTTDAEIASAMRPVRDTRGGIRGLCVRRFPDRIKSIQWERIQFTGGVLPQNFGYAGSLRARCVSRTCAQILETADTPSDALKRWNATKGRDRHEPDSVIWNARKRPLNRCRRPTSPSEEGGGPKRPDTGSPDKDNLMKRMRKVDPKQAERYRQRTGE